MENTKLEMLSTMVTSALAKIIDENSTFTVTDIIAKCSVNDMNRKDKSIDFRIQLIDELLDNFFDDVMEQWKIGNNWTRGFNVTNFKAWFECADDVVKEQVREFIGLDNKVDENYVTEFLRNPNLHRQDIINILDNADVSNALREEWYDDIVDDFFENSDGDDIVDKCSYRQEDQLKEYFTDGIREDVIQECKDALDNL